MDTPERLNRDNLNEIWVDATPDGHYAERILQVYRQRSEVRYRVTGVPEERLAIDDLMNEHQEARARELDEALIMLKRPWPLDVGKPTECSQCGAGADSSYNYCGHCGTRLRGACSACCQPLPPKGRRE